MARFAVAGSKNTTYEFLINLDRDGFRPDMLITLTPEMGSAEKVAGYFDLRSLADQLGILLYNPTAYSLNTDEDRTSLPIDGIELLLVIGWQRLIPEWLLERLRLGAFGMHGSPEPLPRGRGRSPINWSLVNGKTSFVTNLFRYDSGIDSGDIVGSQKFDITLWDDCNTLHQKNRIAMNRLVRKFLPELLSENGRFYSQPKDIEPTFLPKRTAEDGRIYWENSDMKLLYDHVRAQTRPFPGAFSHKGGSPARFYFWKVHPFDGHLDFPDAPPGTVVDVFSDGSFLVSVWDGSIRIHDYSSPEGGPPEVGERFLNHPIIATD